MTFAVEMREPHVAGDTPAASVTATFDKCNGFYPFATYEFHRFNKFNVKTELENYLFEDYHLKSGIMIWILTLRTTGRQG